MVWCPSRPHPQVPPNFLPNWWNYWNGKYLQQWSQSDISSNLNLIWEVTEKFVCSMIWKTAGCSWRGWRLMSHKINSLLEALWLSMQDSLRLQIMVTQQQERHLQEEKKHNLPWLNQMFTCIQERLLTLSIKTVSSLLKWRCQDLINQLQHRW